MKEQAMRLNPSQIIGTLTTTGGPVVIGQEPIVDWTGSEEGGSYWGLLEFLEENSSSSLAKYNGFFIFCNEQPVVVALHLSDGYLLMEEFHPFDRAKEVDVTTLSTHVMGGRRSLVCFDSSLSAGEVRESLGKSGFSRSIIARETGEADRADIWRQVVNAGSEVTLSEISLKQSGKTIGHGVLISSAAQS